MATYRKEYRTSRDRPRRKSDHSPRPAPAFEAGIFNEPNLVFGGHHRHIDPKTGLALYGPYSLGREDLIPLRSITVGIVGTPDLAFRMSNWLDACRAAITNEGDAPFWRPAFPGINKNPPFQCELLFSEAWQETIDQDILFKTLEIPNYWEQLQQIVALYTEAINRMLQREPKPNVIVVITPEEIDASLDAISFQPGAMSGQPTQEISEDLTEPVEDGEIETDDSNKNPMKVLPFNVRRALKAAFMQFNVPTQSVRGSTLGQPMIGIRRQRQDPATSAWNLVAGLYYKAGSHLWRLEDVKLGACYVGVSFYRERLSERPGMRTSLAQIFTHSCDGLILRGKAFKWDRSQGPSPHLPEGAAAELLLKAIELYTDHNRNNRPTRVVVHKSSRFDEAEQRGFKRALGDSIHDWDFVAMEKRGVQFLRQGYHAPKRCTWIRLADNDYILYTRGYIPFFRIYPGMRVPLPLEIIERIGKSGIDSVLNEILAMTKMNWNSADFACEEPITLDFSRRVGDILALVAEGSPIQEEYRFFM